MLRKNSNIYVPRNSNMVFIDVLGRLSKLKGDGENDNCTFVEALSTELYFLWGEIHMVRNGIYQVFANLRRQIQEEFQPLHQFAHFFLQNPHLFPLYPPPLPPYKIFICYIEKVLENCNLFLLDILSI